MLQRQRLLISTKSDNGKLAAYTEATVLAYMWSSSLPKPLSPSFHLYTYLATFPFKLEFEALK